MDCHNMKLRLRQHKRVAMGLSQVAGWGAFAQVGSTPQKIKLTENKIKIIQTKQKNMMCHAGVTTSIVSLIGMYTVCTHAFCQGCMLGVFIRCICAGKQRPPCAFGTHTVYVLC